MLEIIKSSSTLRRLVTAESKSSRLKVQNVNAEEDKEVINKCIHWVESLFPGSVVILCHMKHLVAPYVSKRCKDLLGYDSKEFQSITPEDFLSLIHPDDMPKIMEGFKTVEDLSKQWPLHTLRFVFNYRFKHKSGHYISVRDERVAILSESLREIYFILLSKSAFDFIDKASFEAYKVTSNGLKQVKSHKRTNLPFSTRELEVVNLIYRGLSTNEIADFLSISISTVKKHRYSIFKKANVKNSHSLINYARANKLI